MLQTYIVNCGSGKARISKSQPSNATHFIDVRSHQRRDPRYPPQTPQTPPPPLSPPPPPPPRRRRRTDRRRRPDPSAPDYGCFVKELRIVRLVEFQGSPSRRGERLPALKSTTLIAKAKRIPLVDLTPCVIDLTQEE